MDAYGDGNSWRAEVRATRRRRARRTRRLRPGATRARTHRDLQLCRLYGAVMTVMMACAFTFTSAVTRSAAGCRRTLHHSSPRRKIEPHTVITSYRRRVAVNVQTHSCVRGIRRGSHPCSHAILFRRSVLAKDRDAMVNVMFTSEERSLMGEREVCTCWKQRAHLVQETVWSHAPLSCLYVAF